MKPPWYESHGFLPWLILIAVILTATLSIKERWFSLTDLGKYKDTASVIATIIGSGFILIGGLLSYIRFFKGRTLRAKLNINPQVGVIPLDSENLHWIDVEIENCGPVAVWRETLDIYATLHGANSYCVRVDNFMPLISDINGKEFLIDVGESAHEHAFLGVPKDIYAVTYHIIFTEIGATTWTRFITSNNDSAPK